ncbi:MAG: hypothetical protein KME64_03930 [Scytonematopsis contorta HA4267-MV1]|nr:hypothetical protein [Scytonematopsis contorta HA4267-MV1]
MKLFKVYNQALETINSGLHAVATEMKKDRENREFDRLYGRMTDEDKIKLLKYDLYSATSGRSNPENLEQYRKTIELLSQEIERERKNDAKLSKQLSSLINSFIIFVFLASCASTAIYQSGKCNRINSQFCRNVRIIPGAIDRYFYNEPTLLNPKDFE